MDKINLLQVNSTLVEDASKQIRVTINSLLDADSFVETDMFMSGKTFTSGEEALGEGVLTGYGLIKGKPVYLFAQNSEVLKGSVSKAHANKIIKCMNLAIRNNVPFISIIDSAGARIGEGVSVMEGYAELLAKSLELKSCVPHIAVALGNCVGMMATFAATADYVIGTANSVLSFNSPTVVMANAGKNDKLSSILGAKAQKSTLVSIIADEKKLSDTIFNVLDIIDGNSDEATDDPNRVTAKLNKDYKYADLIKAICDDGKNTEINASFAQEVKTSYAKINGITVGLVVSDKSVSELLTYDGMDKIISFVKSLDMLDIPLITLVDFKGVKSCLDCEQEGFSIKTAQLFEAINNSDINKISVILGNAIGYVYSALCSKNAGFDYTFATTSTVVSPILPEAATNFYVDEIKAAKDPLKAKAELEKKYIEDCANPFIAAKEGYIDNIIEPQNLRPYLASTLLMLLGI